MPVQRIPRYCLLLYDLVKNTPESLPSYEILTNALSQIKSAAEYVDSVKGQTESMEKLLEMKAKLPNADLLLKPGRNLLHEGPANLISSSKDHGSKSLSAIEKVTSLSPSAIGKMTSKSMSKLASKLRKKSVYLYLFNDLLVITSKATERMLSSVRRKTLKEVARFEINDSTRILSMIEISKKVKYKGSEKELQEMSKNAFAILNASAEFIFEIKDEVTKDSWIRSIEQAIATLKK